MSTSNTRERHGSPLYFFLGLVPFLLVLAINLLVSIGAVFLVVMWMAASKGITSVPALQQQAFAVVLDHTMAFTMAFQVPALICIFLWYWFAYARKKKVWNAPDAFSFKKSLLPIAILALGASQLVGLVMLIEGKLFPGAMAAYESLMESTGIGGGSILAFVSTIFLAPLMEELTFRGLTVQILKRTGWRFWLINLIQAALFGLFHMNLIQGIYAFLLGLLLGYVCETYGSLKASILLHAVFNICGSYLQSLLDLWLKNTKTLLPNIVLAVIGAALMLLAFRLIKKEVTVRRQALETGRENEPAAPASDFAG